MQAVSLLFVLVKSIFAKTVRPTQGFASLRPKPVHACAIHDAWPVGIVRST